MRPIPPEPCPVCATACACIVDSTLIRRPNVYECAEHGMFQEGVLTGIRPICTRCGHPEMPMGGGWCDEVIGDDHDLCCDGCCIYPDVTLITPNGPVVPAISRPTCDVPGCTAEGVNIGQSFEPGKEVSARCNDHRWTADERRQMIAAHARSALLWGVLTPEEQALVLATDPTDRSQLFKALVLQKIEPES